MRIRVDHRQQVLGMGQVACHCSWKRFHRLSRSFEGLGLPVVDGYEGELQATGCANVPSNVSPRA